MNSSLPPAEPRKRNSLMRIGLGGSVPTKTALFVVALWPSGFVIVMFFAPRVAATVLRASVTCVGSTYVTLLTVTRPVTVAAKWLKGAAGGPRFGHGA